MSDPRHSLGVRRAVESGFEVAVPLTMASAAWIWARQFLVQPTPSRPLS